MPSQRTTNVMLQVLQSQLCGSFNKEQAEVSESLTASDYEFTESVLADMKVIGLQCWHV